jgi:hypothetical protein
MEYVETVLTQLRDEMYEVSDERHLQCALLEPVAKKVRELSERLKAIAGELETLT